MGYIATITFGHTKEIDLIVAHPDGRKISIDVKGLKNTTNWPINPKLIRKDHFYVLVSYLSKYDDINIPPQVFVIPSSKIKKILGRWSGKPNVRCVNYQKVKDGKYKNAWHLLFNCK
jgi:hypothetical protein